MVDSGQAGKGHDRTPVTQAAQIARLAKKYMCMSICSGEPEKA
jgi:hypothetical protein